MIKYVLHIMANFIYLSLNKLNLGVKSKSLLVYVYTNPG